MKTQGHEPAHPTDVWFEGRNGFQIEGTDRGMTKREAFAMAAMQGFCAIPKAMTYDEIAKGAVKMADALIVELNKAFEQPKVDTEGYPSEEEY